MPPLTLTRSGPQTVVEGNEFRLVFDEGEGVIVSLRFQDNELVASGPRLNVWRAPTENDLSPWGDERAAIRWREVGLDQLEERVTAVQVEQVAPQVVRITARSVSELGEDAVLPEPPSEEERWAMLGQGLDWLLDQEALRMLCPRLDIAYDELPGTHKRPKLQALVARVAGENRQLELLQEVHNLLRELDREIPKMLDAIISSGQPDALPPPNPPARFECEYTYTVYGSGDVVIDARVAPEVEVPFLPRIGLQMQLPVGYEQFAWYGRGPHETYVDRKEGAPVGVYGGAVDEQYVPYIVPQENGNKTDVRWVALTNQDGIGLLASGDRWLEVSAHHYSTEDLTRATHTHELERREEITLNLDYAQSGLGSASCGPGRLEEYQLKPEEVRYSVRLRPFSSAVDSPMALSKQPLAST
jgi:hypothetical protein